MNHQAMKKILNLQFLPDNCCGLGVTFTKKNFFILHLAGKAEVYFSQSNGLMAARSSRNFYKLGIKIIGLFS